MHTFNIPTREFRKKHSFFATFASFYLGIWAMILPVELQNFILDKVHTIRAKQAQVPPLFGRISLVRRRREKNLGVCP